MLKALAICSVVAFVFMRCGEDSDGWPREPLGGAWMVSDVSYDGMLQDEWTGVRITFKQTSKDGGMYSMPETPYDTIWSKSGTWRKSAQPSVLILDDTLSANFQVDSEQLIMAMYLPWTKQSYCTDDVCPAIVSGDWTFKFLRAAN